MNIISLNGEFVELEEARVPATDGGFLLGDGVFETVRVEGGYLVHGEEHFARLARGVRVLEIPYAVDAEQLMAKCHAVLDANQRDRARLRITITRGPARNAPTMASEGEPTEVITAAPLPPEAPFGEQGRRTLVMVPFPRNERSPLATIKCTSYAESLQARRHAERLGFDEGLLLNTRGRVAEAAMANVFAVVDGELCTPPISDGALPGTMRAAVIRLAGGTPHPVRERSLGLEELHRAGEVFLTNSIGQVMPVGRVNEHDLPEEGNPVAQALHDLHRETVERELLRRRMT